MSDAYKVLAVEKNGSELNNQEEVALSASNVTFSDANFSATDANAGIVEAGRFGMKFLHAVDATETSTTSTVTWSTKVTLSETVPAGAYLLFYQILVRSSADREVDVRVMDSASNLFEVKVSIARAALFSGVNSYTTVAGHVYLPSITGAKTFTLDFKVGGSAATVFAREARLSLWRTT